MRIFTFLLVVLASGWSQVMAEDPNPLGVYGRLPLQFEANAGQAVTGVDFLARASGYTLLLSAGSAVLELQPSKAQPAATRIQMTLDGGSRSVRAEALDALPGKVNYMMGHDASHWHTGIPTFGKVQYRQVYPGIDLVYYGRDNHLEYDFVVAPGADVSAIRLHLNGANPVINAQGDLVLIAEREQLMFRKPVIYQMDGAAKRLVQGRFLLARDGEVRFSVGRYRHDLPLVIDPTLVYASYLGASQQTTIYGAAVNSSGQLYVTGVTAAVNFPTTAGSVQPVSAGSQDAFVSKISADGTTLIYSTYLGGSFADAGVGVVVDPNDNAYVTGYTYSNDFPVTPDAIQAVCGPTGSPATASCGGQTQDVFIAKLNPSGTQLLYSTFFGGNRPDAPSNIALDAQGNVYIAGNTNSISTNVAPGGPDVNYPVTSSAFQTDVLPSTSTIAPFVTQFSPDLHTVLYSSLFGVNSSINTTNQAMAVGVNGIVYIGGSTLSPTLPMVNAYQSSCETNGPICYNSGFLAAFDTTASGSASLVFSTYLNDGLGAPLSSPNSGYTETQVHALAADAQNNVYVAGETSEDNLPGTAGSYSPTCTFSPFNSLCDDAIVAKFSAAGALQWLTYYGPNTECCNTVGTTIALDPNNNVYVAGGNFNIGGLPVIGAFQPGPANPGDPITSYIWTLSSDGSQVLFGSYFGGNGNTTPTGLALDRSGNIYIAGFTTGNDMTVTPGALQPATSGGQQGVVAKISCLSLPCPPLPSIAVNSVMLTVSPSSASTGAPVTMTAAVAGQLNHPVPTGSVIFYNGPTPLGQATLDVNGNASFTTSSLAVGIYAITATYQGDTLYFFNTSAAQSLTISAAPAVTTTVVSNVTVSYNANEQFTLTATVTSPAGTVNGGTVTFGVEAPFYTGLSAPVQNGVATYLLVPQNASIFLNVGMYPITASYVPATGFAASSGAATLNVVPGTPTVTTPANVNVTYSPTEQYTLSATVTSTAGVVNGGSVTFQISSYTQVGSITTVSAPVQNGVATYLIAPPNAASSLNAGAYPVFATYVPSAGLAGSSGISQLNVSLPATTTTPSNVTLAYSANEQFMLTATVTSSAGVVNSGSVTFDVDGLFFPTVSAPVQNGVATILFAPANASTYLTTGGRFTISATYVPTPSTYAGSTGSALVTVTSPIPPPSTTTKLSNLTVAFANNEQFTLAATVTTAAGPVNSGSVTFLVNNGEFAPVSASVVNGVATFLFTVNQALVALPVGMYPISATYVPTGNLAGSTGTAQLTVSASAPASSNTTTIASNVTVAYFVGDQFTLSATVASSLGVVNSGSVAFTVNNGSPVSAPVINGIATFLYGLANGSVFLTPATYPIVATYIPSGGPFTGSSGTAQLSVNMPGATTTTISNVSIPYSSTEQFTLSATVASASGPVNSGSVTFGVGGGIYGSGSAPVQNGTATFVFTPQNTTVLLGASVYPISATYVPSSGFTGSTGTAQLTILSVPKAVPVITWPTPASISAGTALSSTQLNATASSPGAAGGALAGTFVYNPPAGTVLAAGAQFLSVTFQPADTIDYASAQSSVSINVVSSVSPVVVTPSNLTVPYSPQGVSSSITLTAAVSNAAPSSALSFTVLGQTTQAPINSGTASATLPFPAATAPGVYPILANYFPPGALVATAGGNAQLTVSNTCPVSSPSNTALRPDVTVKVTRLSKGHGAMVPEVTEENTPGFESTIVVTGGQYDNGNGTYSPFQITWIPNTTPVIPPLMMIQPVSIILNGGGTSSSGSTPPVPGMLYPCTPLALNTQVANPGLTSGTPLIVEASSTFQDPLTQDIFGVQITQRATVP